MNSKRLEKHLMTHAHRQRLSHLYCILVVTNFFTAVSLSVLGRRPCSFKILIGQPHVVPVESSRSVSWSYGVKGDLN